MRGRHRLDAPVERSDELVHRAAALARIHRHHGNAREHVLDAMVELGEEHVAMLLGPLALGDVDGEASQTDKAPSRVKLGSGGLLEPHFPAVRAHVAEGDRIRGILRAYTTYRSLESRTIVRMNLFEE